MRFFIFSITLLSQCFMAICKAETNLALPFPHMVIVGGTGVGKSSLAMALIGEDVEKEDGTFPICWNTDSCTKQTSYANAPWLGNPDNQNFTIVDTPGFSDSDGEMDKLVEEMIDILNNVVKSANVIILAMDSTEARFTDSLTKMLGELEALFGTKMWSNTIIEMTKFSYEADEIRDREEECEKHPEHCQDEDYWYKEMNRQLEDKFHIGMDLPMVFIDSWSQKNKTEDDPIEEEHFITETLKLWDFAMSHDAFEFKSIDEVLDENEKLRVENEELEEKVDDLNNNIEDLNTHIENLDGEIDRLNNEIDDYVKDSAVRGIFVQIGDNGCDKCTLDVTILSEGNTECNTGILGDKDEDDWEKDRSYGYMGSKISSCNGFDSKGGVQSITVTHDKSGGVCVDYWLISTDNGLYYCPGGFFDRSDSATVLCERGGVDNDGRTC